MVAVHVISYFPPSSPFYPPSLPKVCRIFNQQLNPSYNTEIIYIIQIILLGLLAILCITLCILSYLNYNSEHRDFLKLLCNLFLIVILCILFSTSFLWDPICN